MSSTAGQVKNTAIKRIKADIREMMTDPSDRYFAAPLEDNMFDWHFTIRGPSGTEFETGIYHGRILLPADYPFRPPNIVLLTPTGRFQTKQKICLSISAYHPEHWAPAWGIRLILEALISFMPSPGDGAIGALDYSPEERKRLAEESKEWECSICGKIKDLVPELKPSAEGERPQSKYADQIAQLHLHSIKPLEEKESASDDTTTTTTTEDEVLPPLEPTEPSVVVTPPPVVETPETPRTDPVDTMLHYAIVALVLSILAIMYHKLLKGFGVIPE